MSQLIEQALWASAQEDYVKALKIAKLAWEGEGEDAVVQSAAATILIHVTKLRDQHSRTERELSQVPPALRHDTTPAFDGTTHSVNPNVPSVPACPKCGGAMKENDKRKTEKSPHYVCLQTRGECGKPSEKGGFFPTGAWKK